MKKILIGFLLFFSLSANAIEIELICRFNGENKLPIPFKFIKKDNNKLGDMYRFDRNVNGKLEGESRSYGTLKELKISKSQISYNYEEYGFKENTNVIDCQASRTGSISRVDGTWNEYFFTNCSMNSDGQMRFVNNYGQCENRKGNKF
jgi:hypothetical protein